MESDIESCASEKNYIFQIERARKIIAQALRGLSERTSGQRPTTQIPFSQFELFADG